MNVVPRFCTLSTTTMTPGASMKPRRAPCDVLAVSLLVPACGLLAFGLLAFGRLALGSLRLCSLLSARIVRCDEPHGNLFVGGAWPTHAVPTPLEPRDREKDALDDEMAEHVTMYLPCAFLQPFRHAIKPYISGTRCEPYARFRSHTEGVGKQLLIPSEKQRGRHQSEKG